tara:strand:+ start:1818 stop:1997 length:180 start_codon:yes stop_codon:yes gene_type:complete
MGHLKDNDITYTKHLTKALNIGTRMILSGFACCIHSVFPFIFQNTASSTIKQLKEKTDG